ncbi:DNA-3-methyladenine glycosylase family protein [Marinomonas pollencensis]|uniref:DNA-3-methyladenine glycosylase II n=1 Tax=Marinomonas pollencensis TaxID=491954 RepID=A0A3E0DQ43_9GAMM|nr:DNA-3-methyladenine glycosylase [Marinomonas pollencensis]REG85076.1 DNA-3-methyladenine glycosylase II [Marinomonas pollencensis]
MTNPLFKALPSDFNKQDFIAFHHRDEHEVAERYADNVIEKGLIWGAYPARLCFDFNDVNRVQVSLHCDAEKASIDSAKLSQLADHMLGLDQRIEAFERFCSRQNTPFSHLVQQQKGLRIPQSASPFEAFSWAIIGQQISVKAAISIRRRFIQTFGMEHSSGLLCYPTAESLQHATPESLQASGLSNSKAATLLLLAEHICQQKLVWPSQLDHTIIGAFSKQLLALKGIGPWTVSYGLLRGFGWLDGSLHGDVAVRRHLSSLLATPTVMDAKATEQWLADYAPWRALAGAHLWAMGSASGY